jgi:methyl-accepting chemotaxis protein
MNKTKKHLARRLVLFIYISILIGAALYSILVPMALNFDRTTTIDFFRKKFITVGSMSILATWILYILYRPVQRCITLGTCQADGSPLYQKARKALTILPRFIFAVGALSYSLGVVISLGLDAAKGAIPPMNIAVGNFIAAFIWGFVNGIITERIVNIILIESKTELKIEDMEGKKAYSSITHLFLPIAIILTWLLSYTVITFLFSGSTTLTGITWKLAIYLAISLFLSFLIFTEFSLSLKNLQAQISKLSGEKMDLSQKIYITSFDDIGTITEGMNRIIGNLHSTFSRVRRATGEAYSSSSHAGEAVGQGRRRIEEMNSLMAEMESGFQDQIGTTKETGSTVSRTIGSFDEIMSRMDEQAEQVNHIADELKKMITHMESVSGKASQADEMFRMIGEKLDSGSREVNETAEEIEGINSAGKKVAETLSVINDIADRINLISMNAAIESAKAGSAGKGFAVVASEIRKLADNTSGETDAIARQIESMQAITEQGLRRFAALGYNLQEIFSTVEETGKSVAEITESSLEMASRGRDELTEVQELVELTGTLKGETEKQKEANRNLKSATDTLSEASQKLTELRSRMKEGIDAIEGAFENISSDYEKSHSSNRELEELVESFKID